MGSHDWRASRQSWAELRHTLTSIRSARRFFSVNQDLAARRWDSASSIRQAIFIGAPLVPLASTVVSLHACVDAFGQLPNPADILAAEFAVYMTVVHVLNVLVKHDDGAG